MTYNDNVECSTLCKLGRSKLVQLYWKLYILCRRYLLVSHFPYFSISNKFIADIGWRMLHTNPSAQIPFCEPGPPHWWPSNFTQTSQQLHLSFLTPFLQCSMLRHNDTSQSPHSISRIKSCAVAKYTVTTNASKCTSLFMVT